MLKFFTIFLASNKPNQTEHEMKKHLFLAIIAFGFISLPGIFTSCSSETKTTSIEIPVDTIFRSIVKSEQAATEPQNEYKLNISVTSTNSSYTENKTITWQEENTVSQTFDNIPIGISLVVTAEITENEHIIFKGKSTEITTTEGENNIEITMRKVLSSITVKTETKEVADCNIEIAITTEDKQTTSYNIPGNALLDGYEIKYLPVDKSITVSAEAKSGGITIYRGSKEFTVTKELEKNIFTFEMKKIESDSSIEIKQFPQNIILETSFDSDNSGSTSISLNKITATFKISYLEGNDNKLLPEWITYSWKLNETPFEIDGTVAKFEKTTGKLSIDITKMKGILLDKNQLVVELGCEDSSEVTAASVNFTVTE